jgi:putative oxidoreductase
MDLGPLLLDASASTTDFALLLGRVAIGVCFVIHGLGKLGLVGTGTMEGFAAWLAELGMPLAPVQARIAMLSEIAGGTLLAVGFLTRPACALLLVTMVVAGRVGHRGAGYLITNDPPGGEYTVNLAVVCVVLALLGPGRISADFLLF